ncbi:DUF5050 domain-containing protein [Acetivibrio cellulolyticus]|uniref:DUF5050 domain-containing protein n=1 Tax=Acetivibrio cellulolyticus TaxID=35830 RepID=UPI0001E2BA52|nr:DUF5050 domain-containing protein [Acetivibrio cellulolyticus]
MNKKIKDKDILTMISNAVESVEIDVFEKIKASQKTGLENINLNQAEVKRKSPLFTFRKTAYIATAVILLGVGIYTVSNLGHIINKNNTKMYTASKIYMVENNGNIYFPNFTDNSKLYSMDYKGKNIKKITEDSVFNIATDGRDICYNDYDGKNYVIGLDGTNKIELSKVKSNDLKILDKSVYYSADDGIYKIKTDGTEAIKISDIVPNMFTVNQGMIYFSTISEDKKGVYSMNLDGSNCVKIFDTPINNFKIANGEMFFYDVNDKNCLHKLLINDKKLTKLSTYELNTGAFDIKDNQIYFISSSESDKSALYKMNIDGTNINKIVDIDATSIQAIGEYVYCYHPSYTGRLYIVSLKENTVKEVLSNKK